MIRAVPLFGRHQTERPSEEDQRAAEVDLERIRQGGIPLGAEQRLKRIATASTPFFTSDLTTKEYALSERSGLVPIAQVMGSSVVQHGYRGQQPTYRGIHEMPALSEPWNLARTRAFSRLEQEARLAGAHGVIAIELEIKGHLGDAANVEYGVFGTAVRTRTVKPDPANPVGRPAICTLSGQDVVKLRQIGAAILGVVGYTTVLAVGLGADSNNMINLPWTHGYANQEISEVASCLNAARKQAFGQIDKQAKAVGADDIVLSTFEHSIDHDEYEVNHVTHHFFVISVHVLGTAVRLGAHEVPDRSTPGLTINLSR